MQYNLIFIKIVFLRACQLSNVITDGPSMPITFNHSKNPFRELCRIYKNSANKLVRPPVVYFVSESGKEDLLEEEAADIGGPLREFFTIALESLSKETAPQLFEGDDDHKLPVHSQQLVLCGYFKMMGEIVAHAIIHDEVWFAGLARAVKVYLSTGCTETTAQVVCTEDVPDLNVRKVLQRMSQVDEDEVAFLNSEDIVSNLLKVKLVPLFLPLIMQPKLHMRLWYTKVSTRGKGN